MNRVLNRVLPWLAVDPQATIEQGLFQVLTLLAGLLAMLVIVPMNLIQGLPGFVNVCVALFGGACLWLYVRARRGQYGVGLLFILLMVTLDAIWFTNAGTQGSIGLFFFTAAMYLVIFFKGWMRWAAFGIYLVNGVAMLALEWIRPDLVRPFVSREARFMDLTTGFIICSIICVLILWGVLAAYYREREGLSASLAAQRESQARFRSLVMHAPIPICVATTAGRVEYLNHRFEQVLGYTLEDLPDLESWWQKAHPQPHLREQASALWAMVSAEANSSGAAVPPAEHPVVCKDGRVADMEIQAAVIGDHWLVMFTDVSDRKRGEEALRQAQKFESLGVLAGGIAHDFNNLLSAMLGNLNLAQMKLPPGGASAPYLENMEGTIRKAAELTRQMLAYSGKGRFVVEPMDLNRLVLEITHLLAVSISKKARLEYALGSGLPAIEADSAQLQQVVMNLVTNASEAIGEHGGVITIGTHLRTIDAKEAEWHFPGQEVAPGTYVTLKVEDTGCGMGPEVLARIFDPFFSTKGMGRGLGLSAMFGILRGHGAAFEIHSEPGRGSTFQVHFRASAIAVPLEGKAEAAFQMDAFHGKVLLVDDEPDLRFSFGSMLHHLGFQVVAARDGFEALERFTPGEFAIVFMDLTMPRMGGQEAFLQMKARDPEVRVILVSGYSEGEAIETLHGLRPAAFIQKPFSLNLLTRVLERVLT